MYLKENLARLNKKFNPKGLEFREEGNIVKIIESKPYLFNKFESLKQLLRNNFGLKFIGPPGPLWHFDSAGIEKLNARKLKMEPSKTIDELKQQFYKFLDEIKEGSLKNSMKTFFEKTEWFFQAPASLGLHHAYEGGLLEHTVQTTRLALVVLGNLDEDTIINKDLMIAGAILHDVGKMNCYQIDGNDIERTKTYYIQNHIVNGIKLVSKNIDSEQLDEIIHIIASHHNLKEWGSPIEPKFNEAWIIHFIENLSSKLMG